MSCPPQENLKGDANRRRSNFTPDPNVPEMFRAGNEDFKAAGRGWSRGHMAPAGNMKLSQDAMDQTFFLSNILPQNHDNNGGKITQRRCHWALGSTDFSVNHNFPLFAFQVFGID